MRWLRAVMGPRLFDTLVPGGGGGGVRGGVVEGWCGGWGGGGYGLITFC